MPIPIFLYYSSSIYFASWGWSYFAISQTFSNYS